MTDFARRPTPVEHAPYYRRYVEAVPDGDIVATLGREVEATVRLVAGLPDRLAGHRYAPDKWSVREVLGHLIDCERVFGYRALRFARGDATPLAGFDENAWSRTAPHDRVPVRALAEELALVRRSHVLFFGQLDEEAWGRTGEANGHPVTVRALAWILAGHELHHRAILGERYGLAGPGGSQAPSTAG